MPPDIAAANIVRDKITERVTLGDKSDSAAASAGSHELLSECIIWDFAEEAWSKLLGMDGNPDQWSQR